MAHRTGCACFGAGGAGRQVEGPDLHGADALAEQVCGELAGAAFHPGASVLVGAVAEAGVVDGDAVAAAAAEEVVDGLAGVLAGDVPEGDVDGADGAGFGAAEAVGVDGGEHGMPVALDVEGILFEEEGGELVVDEGADGAGRVGGLAEADGAVVCVDAQPERVGVAAEADGFEADDFHGGQWLVVSGLGRRGVCDAGRWPAALSHASCCTRGYEAVCRNR